MIARQLARLGLGAALLGVALVGPPAQAQTPQGGKIPVGINADFGVQSLTDIFRSDDRFATTAGGTLTPDAQGNPTSDFEWIFDNRITLDFGPPLFNGVVNVDPARKVINVNGTYKLSFTGQAVLADTSGTDTPATPGAGHTTIANQVYDPATNTTTADVVMNYQPPIAPLGTAVKPDGLLLVLAFTATRLHPTDAPGTGVTNLKLTLPGYSPSSTQTLSDPWVHYVRDYPWTHVRFMGALGMNSYGATGAPDGYPYRLDWNKNRVYPDKGLLYNSDPAHFAIGVPWEYVVLAAQQTGKDVWVNIPVNASDDYVNQAALLLKNGDAFTGGRGIPSTCNVYVEYSNEMWHLGFAQGPWNKQAAADEVAAGGSNLDYDHAGNGNDIWRFRRIAKRTVEIGQQFKAVFNDNGARIRPVWNNAFTGYDPDMLAYVEANYGTPSKFLYGISQTGYFGSGGADSAHTQANRATVDTLLSTCTASIDTNGGSYQYSRALATYYGLHSLTYEGGFGDTIDPAFQTGFVAQLVVQDPTLPNVFAAARDPRMGDENFHDLSETWAADGGDEYTEFAQGGGYYSVYGFWGQVEDLTDLSSGKFQGCVQAMTTPAPAVTAGLPAPTAQGQSYSFGMTEPNAFPLTNPQAYYVFAVFPIASGWSDTITPGGYPTAATPWQTYMYSVKTPGVYSLVLTGQDLGGAKVRVMVDDRNVGSPAFPTAAHGPASAVTFNLSPGLHTVCLYVDAGSVNEYPANPPTPSPNNQPPDTATLTLTQVAPSNVTPSVGLRFSGLRFDRAHGLFHQTATLTNTGTAALAGPLYLVLDGLTPGIGLSNSAGKTADTSPTGSPYVTSASGLAPNASVSLDLAFYNPHRYALAYTPRVLAGPGAP